jgi:hypothetical protein
MVQQLLLALSPMNNAKAQANVSENASQDRFVNIALHGARDKHLPVGHALLSEE